jgi:hypothetical protein
MHPMRHIEEIKSTLEEDEAGAAEIRAAARLLEASTPVGEVLAAVAATEFESTLIARSQGCPAPEERAWLTLAAAGARRARLVLAWRAGEVLRASEIGEVFVSHRKCLRQECRRRSEIAADKDHAGAWALLSWLSAPDLGRLVLGRPALAGHYRRARAKRFAGVGAPPWSTRLGALSADRIVGAPSVG